MRCWHDDVVLMEEEMGRTIQYGYWEVGKWLVRSVAREGSMNVVLGEGLKAYVLEQVHHEAKTCDQLKTRWALWRELGQRYLMQATPASNTLLPAVEEEHEGDDEDDNNEEGAPDHEDVEE
jgi:hypothetical protein